MLSLLRLLCVFSQEHPVPVEPHGFLIGISNGFEIRRMDYKATNAERTRYDVTKVLKIP